MEKRLTMRLLSLLTTIKANSGRRSRRAAILSGLLGLAMGTPSAIATFHAWDITEIYSNADGTQQFIEWFTTSPSQNSLNTRWVTTDANTYQFQANLPLTSTVNQHFLMATAGFAALPGAPTPDFIIPDGFIDVSGDTLELRTTPAGTLYDTFSFGMGELPTDGTQSLVCATHPSTTCTSTVVEVNSPTNFAGQMGTVSPPDCVADLDGDGDVDAADLAELLAAWGPVPTPDPPDFDGDGVVNAADLAELLAAWGSCP